MQKRFEQFSMDSPSWKQRLQAAGRLGLCGLQTPSRKSHLHEIRDFGSNPGALRMFAHVPAQLSDGSALVVVLHGCLQSAADYDHGAGWSTLADRFGFCLLLPEQQKSNNPNRCFNWFQPGDTERGRGEAYSICQMVEKMLSDHALDPQRIFVTGLSAGGAMTSVMLATYPDVFAGGAIVAGLPYGSAASVQEAFKSMFQAPPRSAQAWGDLVRGASPHRGPWPRVSVWHGGADVTVVPSNASEIIKQWTDVHGFGLAPTRNSVIDGHPRQVWATGDGREMIESYTIRNMGHGTPLATGAADGECGAAAPYLLDVGISSSYHIAKFFGLTGAERRNRAAESEAAKLSRVPHRDSISAVLALQPQVLEGEVLGPEMDDRPNGRQAASGFQVASIINNALRAAGLMK